MTLPSAFLAKKQARQMKTETVFTKLRYSEVKLVVTR